MRKFLFVALTLILLFPIQPAFAEKGNGNNSSWSSIGISYSDPGLTNCPQLSINVNANWYRFQIYAKGDSSPNFQLLNPINQQTENLTNKGIIRNNIDAPGGWSRNYCNGITGYKVQNLSFEKLYDADGRYVGYKSVDRMKTEFRIDGSRRISQNPLKFEKAYTTSGEFFWNKTFVFRSIPTPKQTANPTPQQTTNPTPQQTTNPTPQQTTNPTPQQTTNPTPQPTKSTESYTPPMPDFSNYYEENKEIEKRVRQELINEIKITKQFTCKKYSRWNNFSNIAPPTFNEDGEMCMDYNAITTEETRVANVHPRYMIKNLIELGAIPSAGLAGSKVTVYAVESKKKSKLIFQGKLKDESRRDLGCQFVPPTDYWGIQGCNYIYEGAFLTVKIPKKMGEFPNLKQRVKIVIENKNSIDKKITWYVSKNGMVEE